LQDDRRAHDGAEDSFVAKYRKIEPLATPARMATSSRLIAAKPWSAESSPAAAIISAGRASLRLRHSGALFGPLP
jgi:hypothetical protein